MRTVSVVSTRLYISVYISRIGQEPSRVDVDDVRLHCTRSASSQIQRHEALTQIDLVTNDAGVNVVTDNVVV